MGRLTTMRKTDELIPYERNQKKHDARNAEMDAQPKKDDGVKFVEEEKKAAVKDFNFGKGLIVALLCGAPCLALVGLSSSATAMVVMTALYGVCRGAFEVNTHASVFDVVAPEHRSTVVGCMVMSAFFFKGTPVKSVATVPLPPILRIVFGMARG